LIFHSSFVFYFVVARSGFRLCAAECRRPIFNCLGSSNSPGQACRQGRSQKLSHARPPRRACCPSRCAVLQTGKGAFNQRGGSRDPRAFPQKHNKNSDLIRREGLRTNLTKLLLEMPSDCIHKIGTQRFSRSFFCPITRISRRFRPSPYPGTAYQVSYANDPYDVHPCTRTSAIFPISATCQFIVSSVFCDTCLMAQSTTTRTAYKTHRTTGTVKKHLTYRCNPWTPSPKYAGHPLVKCSTDIKIPIEKGIRLGKALASVVLPAGTNSPYVGSPMRYKPFAKQGSWRHDTRYLSGSQSRPRSIPLPRR